MTGLPGTRLTPDPPGRRAALVIATTTHQDPELRQLRSPARDAADLAAVLGDPGVGAFTVTRVSDADERHVRRAIDAFLSGRSVGDLVVVYLSCHGVLDRRNRLYFAAADTLKSQLGSTGIPSAWVLEQLEECRARSKVLILDCCFSGAFAHGSKGDVDLDLARRLVGHGRGQAVLTASRASEYSFEGQALPGVTMAGSVFSAGLVEGLRTGAADVDGDGYVSVDEAYAYAYDYVVRSGASQTPQRWLSGGEGAIVLARSPAGTVVTPAPRPVVLASSLDSPYPGIRVTRLIADAESAAQSITNESSKASVLATLAETLAATDLGFAERIAQSITDKYSKACALEGIAGTLAATDPGYAERIAQSITHEHFKAGALARVAQGLAASNPSRAERIAESITDEHLRALTLARVAKTLTATDPGRATRLIAEAQRMAQSMEEGYGKVSALAFVGKVLAATDPGRATRLIADAERIAQSIKEGDFGKGPALTSVAEALAAIDPGRAERTAHSITNEEGSAATLSFVAGELAATRPGYAERIAQSITDEYWKAEALRSVAQALPATDPDHAVRIAESITDERVKALTLATVAKALAASDPGRAARLIANAERIAYSITDESSKASALSSVAEALAATSD
jgi:hypothetical protein